MQYNTAGHKLDHFKNILKISVRRNYIIILPKLIIFIMTNIA